MAKKDEPVLIEKLKGYEIYLDKQTERYFAEKKKLNIRFEDTSLWGLRAQIAKSQVETIDKKFFIKSGYFGRGVARVHLLTKNKALKICEYKIIKDTDKSYDDGKIRKERDTPKFFDINEHNQSVYDEVLRLQAEIHKLEKLQQQKVIQLK